MPTKYISPTGAGDKSGSSWANAAPITSLDAMVAKAGAGGTVYLAADKGDYVLKGPLGITGSSVTISGMNTNGTVGEAHFVGTRAVDWKAGAADGNELFRIQKGADNLVFQNMQIDNTATAFRVGGDVKNLTIQHVDASNVQRFFEDYISGGNTTATISGLTIRDVDVTGFSKGVIRLQYDTHDVLIEDVRGDSKRQDGDSFAMGVHLEDTAHNVVFRRVTMENATADLGDGRYWQGDGFASERGTYNLTFEDTVARGNVDGGYDLKSNNVTMLRALAEDNGRNFRFWGTNVTVTDSVGLNPNVRGGISTQAQVWLDNTAQVKIVNSKFSDAGSKTKVFDNSGALELVGTIVQQAADASTYIGKKPVGYAVELVSKIASVGLASPTSVYADGTKPAAFVPAPTVPVIVVTPTAPPTTVELPKATTPVPSAPQPVSSVKAGDWVKQTSTSASETFGATSLAESFFYDQSKANGADTIKNFGANDLIVFKQKLGDANSDGITGFGKDGVLSLGASGSVKIEGVTKGLRFVGETAEGYAYGDAAVWKAGSKLPTALAATKTVSTAANEQFLGTNARDTFYFDVRAGKTGTDTVLGFGKTDVIATGKALADGNNDGFIVPGGQGLDLGDKASIVKGLGMSKVGLRALGSDADGFIYADGAVRPKGALEGKLTVADTLAGDKGDAKSDAFFFDAALHRQTGADAIVNFGAKDVVISTSALGSGAVGAHIDAVGGKFAVVDAGDLLGSFTVKDAGGAAVSSLEYDGSRTVDGVTYYVYSAVGSAAGLDKLVM